VVAREEKRNKKRKKEVDYTSNTLNLAGPSTSTATASNANPKPTLGPTAPKKTGVYVTNLPPHTTPELLSSVFSKAGVLLIGDDGEPRIKMYLDEKGEFKGEALIIYFKEGSVDLAITLLDDTELELGGGYGNMRVKVAEYDKSGSNAEGKKKKAEGERKVVEGDDKGETVREKKKPSAEEKQRMTKRIKTMQK
jgi:HIV Tat-specific factor 1